jgi:hypothetical protein
MEEKIQYDKISSKKKFHNYVYQLLACHIHVYNHIELYPCLKPTILCNESGEWEANILT